MGLSSETPISVTVPPCAGLSAVGFLDVGRLEVGYFEVGDSQAAAALLSGLAHDAEHGQHVSLLLELLGDVFVLLQLAQAAAASR